MRNANALLLPLLCRFVVVMILAIAISMSLATGCCRSDLMVALILALASPLLIRLRTIDSFILLTRSRIS
jgi:hypothetical protein